MATRSRHLNHFAKESVHRTTHKIFVHEGKTTAILWNFVFQWGATTMVVQDIWRSVHLRFLCTARNKRNRIENICALFYDTHRLNKSRAERWKYCELYSPIGIRREQTHSLKTLSKNLKCKIVVRRWKNNDWPEQHQKPWNRWKKFAVFIVSKASWKKIQQQSNEFKVSDKVILPK